MPTASFWGLYCQPWTYFKPCSSIPIANFEQVNAGWNDLVTNGLVHFMLDKFAKQKRTLNNIKHVDKKYERCSNVFIADFEKVFTHV